jgi:hypothetical protein
LFPSASSIVVVIHVEVIDIPRQSPHVVNTSLRLLPSMEINDSNRSMYRDRAHVDTPPTLSESSSPPLQQHHENDNDERQTAKRFMDRFSNDRSARSFESKLSMESLLPIEPFAIELANI